MQKISVIIPNYNHACFLEQRIDSVLNQTFDDIEVIILDDCSSDGSKKVIEKYKEHKKIFKIIYNETNSGNTFKQWQKGIETAQGDWIWIAESDDYAEKTFLEKAYQKSMNGNSGIVYCRSNIIDSSNNAITLYNFSSMPDPVVFPLFGNDFDMDGNEFIKDYMLKRNSVPNASAVIFKKDLVDFSVFDDIRKTKLFGDWLFWIHLLRKTRVSYINERLNYFRFHETTVRKHTQFDMTRIYEYMILIKYFEKERMPFYKEALDAMVYQYNYGDVSGNRVSVKDNIKISMFVLQRNPLLLLKTWLRKKKSQK
ncbi:MAG TPA: glycosyltransferase family 2 protein [Bacteroidales bacterium]|nr:glycosyltransferase family 2 protein [Bacteroidales bacterium]HPS15955.1 glycosyltransferase family 2 protein [Bacteroidales bacterium]